MKPVPAEFAQSTQNLADLSTELLGYKAPRSFCVTRASSKPSVLITGGAGFLAVHLLQQLQQTRRFGRVYLLVRRPATLLPCLARYGISSGVLEGVSVLEGDLNTIDLASLPDVDIVLHSAARIHGLKSLRQLWTDNVLATARLFSHYEGKAELHLVSTLSVFVSSNMKGVCSAHELTPCSTYMLYGGYAQSKYICERLAKAFGAHIIRLGLLTGSSTLGRFPENDFFSVFMRSMHRLGCQPDCSEPAWVDVTPVDFAAQKIVQYLENGIRPKIVHIANCMPVSARSICNKLRLPFVDAIEFKEKLAELPGIERILLNYAFFKQESLTAFPQYFNIDLFQSTNHSYSVRNPFGASNDSLILLYLKEAGFDTKPH